MRFLPHGPKPLDALAQLRLPVLLTRTQPQRRLADMSDNPHNPLLESHGGSIADDMIIEALVSMVGPNR